MQRDILYVLADDKEAALARIVELEKEIQDLGPEFHDVFNQSSETWHDNAPFDALRDRQSVLSAELQKLKGVLRQATTSIPKPQKNLVGIGAQVTVNDHTLGKNLDYFIAGDWTYRTGEKLEGATVVSAKAPIALALIGKKVGESAHFKHKMTVVDIHYSAMSQLD